MRYVYPSVLEMLEMPYIATDRCLRVVERSCFKLSDEIGIKSEMEPMSSSAQ